MLLSVSRLKAAFLYLLLHFYSTNSRECSLYEGFRDSHCFWGKELSNSLTLSQSSWIVEFYSSWCGHCHHFAPTWKEVASRIKGWSRVIRIGEIDCSQIENRDFCSEYRIGAFPTIRFFDSQEKHPASSDSKYFVGRKNFDSLLESILSYIDKHTSLPALQPLQVVTSDELAEGVVCLVFEKHDSYIGIEIILDFISEKNLLIRRVHDKNNALVKEYSILHFPSLVLQVSKGRYTVVSGGSAGSEYIVDFLEKKIREFIGTAVQTVNRKRSQDVISTSQQTDLQYAHVARPTMNDLQCAISYSLRMEVPIHHLISDKSFFALQRFLLHLEKGFQFTRSSLSQDISVIRKKLDSKSLAGFILASEWKRLLETKLNTDIFPVEPQWSSCAGSQPHYRGYPCGLWSLMHTVTILSLSLSTSQTYHPVDMLTSSREALYALVGFVNHFFSCEDCRKHFSKMAEGLRRHPISYDGDAILWLWEVHNSVNQRLVEDESTDPAHPKRLFPSFHLCPYCYIRVVNKTGNFQKDATTTIGNAIPLWNNVGFAPGESLLRHIHITPSSMTFHWNKTAVLLFLSSFYGLGHFNDVPSHLIINAAWPRRFPISADHHYGYKGDNSYNIVSSLLFVVQFLICLVLLSLLLSCTLRHRLWKIRFKRL